MSFARVLAGGVIAAALVSPLAAFAQATPTMNSVVAQAMTDSRVHDEKILPDPLANDLPGTAPARVVLRADPMHPDTVTVTNGPVPDTPANRELYGKPMSHAGRATDPTGN